MLSDVAFRRGMQKRRAKAAENGCKAQTVKQLLANKDVDLVVNLTVPALHADVSLAALKAGKHVHGENPLAVHLEDALDPRRARVSGKASITGLVPHAALLLAILADHGHRDDELQAERAYARGVAAAGIDPAPAYPRSRGYGDLDGALKALDSLRPAEKERLLRAMLATVLADDEVAMSELELLRAACAALHLPLPLW